MNVEFFVEGIPVPKPRSKVTFDSRGRGRVYYKAPARGSARLSYPDYKAVVVGSLLTRVARPEWAPA